MHQDQNTPSTEPNKNEYLQPFAIACLAAICGFGYVYYDRGEVAPAIIVGGVGFLILFWVVLRGNKLKKQREKKASPSALTDSSAAFDRVRLWPKVVVSLSLLLLGIAISLYYAFGSALDREKTNDSLRSEAPQDDRVKRVRTIEFFLWHDLSENPHPSFADGVDAAVAELEIPIHSMEKNWPTGPMVVTFEGTAMDADEIFDALRSAGILTSGYTVVK